MIPEGAAGPSAEAALASSGRRRVLDVLNGASHPLDATAVADALGVHVTTARFHLEQLEASGLVQRRPVQERRKGRPRMVYSLASALRTADAREQLIDVLVRAVGGETAGGSSDEKARVEKASVEAGEHWAETLRDAAAGQEETSETTTTANAGRDSLDALVDVLESLGFDPERTGDEVLMRGCPFREAALQRPDVVCSVHRGMIGKLLVDAHETSRAVRLVPFVEPELCVISLGSEADAVRR